jgi:hypothetical protein
MFFYSKFSAFKILIINSLVIKDEKWQTSKQKKTHTFRKLIRVLITNFELNLQNN